VAVNAAPPGKWNGLDRSMSAMTFCCDGGADAATALAPADRMAVMARTAALRHIRIRIASLSENGLWRAVDAILPESGCR
jgi:hypothetical protein